MGSKWFDRLGVSSILEEDTGCERLLIHSIEVRFEEELSDRYVNGDVLGVVHGTSPGMHARDAKTFLSSAGKSHAGKSDEIDCP